MKKKNLIFYIAYTLNLIYVMLYHSEIFHMSEFFSKSLVFLSYALFIIKLFLDKYSIKRLSIYLILSVFFFYLYKVTSVQYIFVAYLAIISFKDVDLKQFLKIDLFVRGFILSVHFALFLADYLFFQSNLINVISDSVKGTSYYLYFSNPNIVSSYFLALIIDILYLKSNIKFKDFIISFIAIYIMFMITKSRSSLISFGVLMALNLIKNKKITYYMAKYTFLVFSIMSFVIAKYVIIGSSFYNIYNTISSDRIKYSILAFQETGLTILPKSYDILQKYIIDNFYIRCFVCYGLIALIIFYIFHLYAIKKDDIKTNRLIITMDFYLFLEQVITNIAYNPFLLILANNLLNKKEVNSNELSINNNRSNI